MTTGPDDKNINEEDIDLEENELEVGGELEDEDDMSDTEDEELEDSDEVSGLRGVSELDSLHEELQNYEESEPEPQNLKSSRSESNEREQEDLTPDYLLSEEVKIRAQRDHEKIKIYLTGKILFVIEDTKQSYIFDWTSEPLKVGPTKETEADCIIVLSEDTLMRIAYGDLNPQVGMLSDKIKVTGKLGLAVYIFNIIAPKNFLH